MDLAVQERSKFGKALKTLRGEGFVPAEFYGHGMQNRHLSIGKKEIEAIFKSDGESGVINLVLGKDKIPSIIHDISHDSISGDIIHIDFYGVRMDEKITKGIPLEFVGESPAAKSGSGVLNKTLSEVEVEALPGDLPHMIEVDLSGLAELNQSLYVKDLKVPAKVKIMLDPDTVVVTVTPPAEEEVVAAPVMDVSEVKVESEEKKAERAEAREADKNEE